jgi:hypothetical protein
MSEELFYVFLVVHESLKSNIKLGRQKQTADEVS